MIRLEHLTKIFILNGRRKTVADNICVDFPTGASVGLLGRNGAGKTTLMQMIAGNMDPTSGRILSDWHDLLSGGLRRVVPRRVDRGAEHPFRGPHLWRRHRGAGRFRRGFRRAGRTFPPALPHLFGRHEVAAVLRRVDGHPVRHLPDRRGHLGRRCRVPRQKQRRVHGPHVAGRGAVRQPFDRRWSSSFATWVRCWRTAS